MAFGFDIVGTGMIAGAIADAIEAAAGARLAAVSSRTQGRAEAFAAGRPGTRAVEGLAGLLSCDDVEAVYVAIPMEDGKKYPKNIIDTNTAYASG